MTDIKGLTSSEVAKKKSLGLSNTVIDSYSPSYGRIIFKNLFSLINIIVFPLLVALASFQLWTDILAFTTFLVVNTVISALDEIRVKRTLDKLKSQFQLTAVVVREGKEITLPVNEVVQGDIIKAKEGESVIADGEIVEEKGDPHRRAIFTRYDHFRARRGPEKLTAQVFDRCGDLVPELLVLCQRTDEGVNRRRVLGDCGTD